MALARKLANPPIEEGLIDLRVVFEAAPGADVFSAIDEELKSTYPVAEDLHRYEASFQFKEGTTAGNSSSQFAGRKYNSANGKFVFQAQIDGFTVSRLRPYLDWVELAAEAKTLWSVYQRHTRPKSVIRVATRFINRFDIPAQVFDFDDYFTAAPVVPTALPQGLSNFLVRLEIPDPESRSTILLTQAMDGLTGFVIDIDVFKQTDLETAGEEWWAELEVLGDLKNRIFFSIVTEKALDLFK